MSDDVKNTPEDCPRCGSLLPDPEEGVCLTCGYEYGRATLYMPVVRLDPKPKADSGPDEPPGAARGPAAPPPAPPSDPSPSGVGRLGLVLVLVVILFIIVVGVIAAMVFL